MKAPPPSPPLSPSTTSGEHDEDGDNNGDNAARHYDHVHGNVPLEEQQPDDATGGAMASVVASPSASSIGSSSSGGADSWSAAAVTSPSASASVGSGGSSVPLDGGAHRQQHVPLNREQPDDAAASSPVAAAAVAPPAAVASPSAAIVGSSGNSVGSNSSSGRNNGGSKFRATRSTLRGGTRAVFSSFTSLRPSNSADSASADNNNDNNNNNNDNNNNNRNNGLQATFKSSPDIAADDYDGDVEAGVHGALQRRDSASSAGSWGAGRGTTSASSASPTLSSPIGVARRSIFWGASPSGILRRDSNEHANNNNSGNNNAAAAAASRRASLDSNQGATSEASHSSSFGSTTGDRIPTGNSNSGGGAAGDNYNPRRTKRSTFRLPLPLFSNSTNSNEDDHHFDANFGSGAGTKASPSLSSGSGYRNRNNRTATNNVAAANTYNTNGRQNAMMQNRTMIRHYGVNNYVLIHNHNIDPNDHPRRYQNLVNRYGFPHGSNAASTSEERRGPYVLLLAQVTSVHFGEDAQYYTVRREDDGEDQRADAEYMEPIANPVGIEAAKAAARKSDANDPGGNAGHSRFAEGENRLGSIPCLGPCARSLGNFAEGVKKRSRKLVRKLKEGTDACMNGNRPYGITIRFTGVNFLVLCSIWYLYVDQLRLAFMPHSADFGCAVVSCLVWIVLACELLLEIFIRPDGYKALIKSDKAYLPSTVRYLNTFHLVSEMVSLIFFIPEFFCLFDSSKTCGDRYSFSLANACIMSLYGPDRLHAFYGTAFLCILRLRIFGLVRHWTKMWINNTFVRVKGKNGEWRVQRGKGFLVPQGHRGGSGQEKVISMDGSIGHQSTSAMSLAMTKSLKDGAGVGDKKNEYTDDYHLTNASKIGTALFTTNAQRGLLFVFMIGLTPLIPVIVSENGGTNQQLHNSVQLLQSNNLALNRTDNQTCNQLMATTVEWVKSNVIETQIDGTQRLHLLSLEMEPVRCSFQEAGAYLKTGLMATIVCRSEKAIQKCKESVTKDCDAICKGWAQTSMQGRLDFLEENHGVRPSVTVPVIKSDSGFIGTDIPREFSVQVLYNEGLSIRRTVIYLFALQLGMTLFVLLGLTVLRYDASRLVLGPLRRMLKIVAFYAKNPLSPPPQREGRDSSARTTFVKQNEAYYYDSDDEVSDKQLGNFETEQLINAVTKITDLLRKCWGVAGADIISSNLARQDGGLTTYFNPTVPGKAVYALFAFVSIDQFQNHLHALKGEIMILINDIASILHEEVFRWGYLDRGQCNKNLGGAFLMVYRIGEVSEVLEKREKAEAVIFAGDGTSKVRRRKFRRVGFQNNARNTSLRGSARGIDATDKYSRSHVDNVDLSSLPGMRTFTDRALLGLLKTFTGIHRDKVILNWNNDFRLGAGVGAVSINLNFGMDAGWAVEGAVGSSYKIDATYLSPHVNMASRMMSATKQYGVYFLLSQAVQKLLSDNAQDKLRHIDTVTVKGSSVQQKIFTYDAKVRSDFFLYSKTEAQADLDSDRYTPAIWDKDQDLVAMRNHIDDDFMDAFNRGRDEYLAGNWPEAIIMLKAADKIMFEREVDEGYSNKSYADNFKSLSNLMSDELEAEERLSMGDGPCQRLIAYMEEMGGEAPSDWRGYRPLTSK